MEIYDKRMQYFSSSDSKGTILCYKASDYKELMGNQADNNVVYKMLGEAVEDMKSELYPSVAFYDYIIASFYVFREDNAKKDQFINDYFRTLEYMDEAIETANAGGDAENANYLAAVKESVETVFVNSGE